MDCAGGRVEITAERVSCWSRPERNAPIFRGHYPHFPIFPGVYLIETALQTVEKHLRSEGFVAARIRRLKSARLMLPVTPDSDIECVATLLRKSGDGGESDWDATCLLEGRPAARIKLSVEGLR